MALGLSCRPAPIKGPKVLRLALERGSTVQHVPFYVGLTLGFFSEEGISLQINSGDVSKFDVNDALHELEIGEVDLAISHMPRVLRACAKNRDFCIVGKLIEKPLNGFIFLQRSGIKTPEDFNGRVLGFSSSHSSSSSSEVLLAERDISPGSKINVGQNFASSLMTKQIDVFYGALRDIESEQLLSLGVKSHFIPVTAFGMPDYDELVVVSRGDLRKEKHLITCFQRALQKSIDYCRTWPDVAFAMYIDHHPEKSEKTIDWERKSWKMTNNALAHSQEFSYERVVCLTDWLQEKGLMGKTIPIDPYISLLNHNAKETLAQTGAHKK